MAFIAIVDVPMDDLCIELPRTYKGDELCYMSLTPWCFVVPQDLVMDILRVLTTPDLEVRKKTLQLALDLVSSRNVEEVSV